MPNPSRIRDGGGDALYQRCRRHQRLRPEDLPCGSGPDPELPARQRNHRRRHECLRMRNPSEIARLLERGGILAVGRPTVKHLHRLVEPVSMVSITLGRSSVWPRNSETSNNSPANGPSTAPHISRRQAQLLSRSGNGAECPPRPIRTAHEASGIHSADVQGSRVDAARHLLEGLRELLHH